MKHLIMVLILAATAGCKDNGVEPGPPDIPAAQLLAAPETVRVEGKSLVLASSLWRDFMPISPPEGKALTGVVTITTLDSTQIPGAVTADAAWIVYQSDVWKTWMNGAPSTEPGVRPFQIMKRIGGGPLWQPGVTVSVIVRIRDSQGNAVLLRASGQLIGRTD